jgi:uncharacterized protein YaaN involved in tellurite resistance
MVANEQSLERQEEITGLVPTGPQNLTPMESPKRTAPQGLSNEESQEIQVRAAELVRQLEGASGSEELELIDSMTNLGMQAQRRAGGEMELLRGRVGDMITGEGPGNELSKDLVELRVALNQINPHELNDHSFGRRLLRSIPLAKKLKPAMQILERIAIRYEPVSKQVSMIETRLRDGRAMLARDNVEMRKLYEQVESQQLPIQRNAYMGELVMAQLGELLERTDDILRAERIRNSLHDVSLRVQDLRTMEAVHGQFFVSIDMSRENNTRLGQTVERTLTLANNVVTVGLAIQVALARQKRVLVATQETREFLGNVIVANAAAIKQHTEEIGDVYNNPVIAIDKISQAHNDLIEAMDTADRLKQEGIDTARENIAKLSQLSSDLQRRALGIREQPALVEQSIEA